MIICSTESMHTSVWDLHLHAQFTVTINSKQHRKWVHNKGRLLLSATHTFCRTIQVLSNADYRMFPIMRVFRLDWVASVTETTIMVVH